MVFQATVYLSLRFSITVTVFMINIYFCVWTDDSHALLSRCDRNSNSTAQKQIELLNKTTEKVGLFTTTEYKDCNKHTPKYTETKYGKVKRIPICKYQNETIQGKN